MEAIAPDARYPYDSYVLPRSSLVEEFIDNTKLEDCWPIYVSGSSKYEDYPIIGYLSRMAPNYDSSKGGYQKFQFTKPQFKYEAFLIILGFNFKELFKVLSLVPRTNLYEPNRNAMKKWEEEARKFMVKCPSYYQQLNHRKPICILN
ncbi:hypothetical protein K502DRAFT_188300 [Neoconidiobolus thromboides FSU 785]|nr:hypothetical protein K502DRAFT_188300 [Neoconidiobolus thromboides FSU 785]